MKTKYKQTMGILLGVMLIAMASAYYPGETITVNHNFGSSDLYLTTDNSSINMSEFILNSNLTHSNITFPQNLPPGSFKLSLVYEKDQEVVYETVYTSGGTRTKYVDRNVTIIEYVDREIDKMIYANYTKPEEEAPEEIKEDEVEEEKWWWFFLIPLIGFIALGINNLIGKAKRKEDERIYDDLGLDKDKGGI